MGAWHFAVKSTFLAVALAVATVGVVEASLYALELA
jgi:hypothetical protein